MSSPFDWQGKPSEIGKDLQATAVRKGAIVKGWKARENKLWGLSRKSDEQILLERRPMNVYSRAGTK